MLLKALEYFNVKSHIMSQTSVGSSFNYRTHFPSRIIKDREGNRQVEKEPL